MIVYTQRYGYAIEFDHFVEQFLTNLHEIDEDKYEELKEKIQEAYPHLHEIYTDVIELGHVELLPGDESDLEEGEEWTPPKELKDMENKILEIIYDFAKSIGTELPGTDTILPGPTSHQKELHGPVSACVFSPQSYVEKMTSQSYNFTYEDTIKEIHRYLTNFGIETEDCKIKDYALDEVEQLLANGSLVVLVNCSGYYGTNEMKSVYRWFEVGNNAMNFI